MSELIYAEDAYSILGAGFEVYNRRGSGFLEAVYQECMGIELQFRGIPFEQHPKLALTYREQTLHQTYEPDFTCYGKIVVELKAVSALTDEHRAQVLNYLHATGYKLGLLMNFGSHPKLEYERLVLDTARRKIDSREA
jgi:GxxExxY protein